MTTHRVTDEFHPVVRRWFERTYGEPTPAQVLGWPSISAGQNTLILAPTGSGKTLAAFLWAINHLVEQHLREVLPSGVRILYVSPLKALNNDIERNLVSPLQGIREEAHAVQLKLPAIRTAVRTGDTPRAKRAAMIKHPPDILITTPESLYLLLTSREARRILRSVQYVIIDEIHSVCGNKRGVHLSISLERLQAVAEQEFVRIGLSATQRPLETIAAFLGGQQWESGELRARPVNVFDAGQKRDMDLKVVCPVPDFSRVPQQSAWPLIFRELLDEIRRHRTTLIFVNNRRLAERVAAALNDMIAAEEAPRPETAVNLHAVPRKTGGLPVDRGNRNVEEGDANRQTVQAYHGSMSRLARERMESELKAGRLKALVATSSLELGIDIGSIDLVLQVESPKGIARGLQRVGRSGHLVTATSKGRILPTHREDLVEATVVARAMMDREVETTTIPAGCLDVLAQHIVAMTSVEDWETDRLFDLIRQSYCYRDLSEKLFSGVLRMLGGRYTGEEFRELRARVSWDKVNGVLRALPGSRQLAVMSGGTIADRGEYGVYLEDGKTKVGVVDEEFVYESRVGDTFILGTNVWRMTAIDGSRVSVAPAPGEPARMPFWRGEGLGRSFELGSKVGEFRRGMSEHIDTPDCLAWLQQQFPVDHNGAWNLQEYFRRQQDVAGVIPHDRLILVEGFRDEIGDPRVVVHSSFGRRVNGLLGMFLLQKLRNAAGIEPQMLYNDDGILLRTADGLSLPLGILEGITSAAVEETVLQEVLESPLFGGQFRQNASRALLLPRPAPGKRTPLWLQRLRAGDLLQIARRFGDFPIVIETVREVLNEVLDYSHFREIVAGIESGTIAVTTTQTEVPSPFASSLLLDFIAVFMYERDQPAADRLGQYTAINRELLSEIVNVETLPSMIRPEAIETVEHQLQHLAEGTRARSAEELMEILLRVGDLSDEEVRQRCSTDPSKFIDQLRHDNRAVQIAFSGEDRWIAGEERDLYAGLDSEDNMARVFRRYLESHGPVIPSELTARYGMSTERVRAFLERLSNDPAIIRGRFGRGTSAEAELEWWYRPNLERIRRQTISMQRREIRPCTLPEFTEFLFRWHHLHAETQLSGPSGLEEILNQLQALALPCDIWEREVFLKRLRDYAPGILASVGSTGAVVWQGTASGRMRPLLRGEGGVFERLPESSGAREYGEAAERILGYLRRRGASFFNDIRSDTRLSLEAMNRGIAELFWAGSITNDIFTELVNVRRVPGSGETAPLERIEVVNPRHNPYRGQILHAARRALRQVPGWSGRWSQVRTADVLGPECAPDVKAARQAAQMLERYGIVAREFHRREDFLPWPLLAAEFQRLELRGEIRRGYFVEGLSGMQYALPEAADALRRSLQAPGHQPSMLLVNACDPAQPYGAGIDLPRSDGEGAALRVNRVPGSHLLFRGGTPLIFIESHGARFWSLPGSTPQLLAKGLRLFVRMLLLPEALRPFREIHVEQVDGDRPAASSLSEVFRSAGFERDRDQTFRLDAYGVRDEA